MGDPRRVFDSASELIAGFEAFDSAVVASIDTKTQTLMVLEDVQSGPDLAALERRDGDSVRPAGNSRARLVLRRCSGSCRRSSPSIARTSKA